MAYRLRVTKKQFGDVIILLLFDKFFDEDFLSQNEAFNDVFDKMERAGLKGKIFQKYFDVEPSIRSKYKQFKRNFNEEGNAVSVYMADGDDIEESTEEYREIILETIKRVTGKEDPDIEKVEEFTNNLLGDILKNEGDE